MNATEAFATYQKWVNARPEEVHEARRLRDVFKRALLTEADILELVTSGSFARKTHRRPIHDLDLIAIFDPSERPEWGTEGDSAEAALAHMGSRINHLLGATNGAVAKEVRIASPRNHAVKCFTHDPGDEDGFTVDAMPALRVDGKLLVPETQSRKWIFTNPEDLIDRVAKRQAEWNRYQGMVRILKGWAALQDFKIKSLVIEVLALDYLEEAGNRPAAAKSFFVRAAWYIRSGYLIQDPSGLCGEIQPDLDYEAFGEALDRSADLAAQAISYAANGNQREAIRAWKDVFGDGFPDPPAAPDGPSKTNPSPGVVPFPPGEEPGRTPIKDTPQG